MQFHSPLLDCTSKFKFCIGKEEKKLDQKIFDAIYGNYKEGFKNGESWKGYAEKYNYVSGEAIRSDFKRFRKRLGLPSKTDVVKEVEVEEKPNVRILCLDLESSYTVLGGFQMFEQNFSPEQVLQQPIMICWSARFLHEDKIRHACLTSKEILSLDDKRITEELRELMESADIILGHNVVGFDLKKINTRLLLNNLKPVRKHQTIDTYLIAKSVFDFDHNSLKGINKLLNIRQKVDNSGFSLWRKWLPPR